MPVSNTPIQTASTSSDAGSLSAIVNAVITRLSQTVIQSNLNETQVGTLADLDTDVKSSIVGAINDLVSKFDSGELVATYIGQLQDLNTSVKSNVVAAINEVNNKVGDIGELETEETSNVVAAINEIFAVVQGLGDIDSGEIFNQLNARVVKTGDTMSGVLNILSGVPSADTPLLGLGWNTLLPSWKVYLDSAESYAMFAFDKTTGLVQGRRQTLDKNGNLTVSGTLRTGSGTALFDTDGSIIGTAWAAVGGSANAISSINAKFAGYFQSTGGTITGKLVENIGFTGNEVTFRDLKYGNATFRSWEEIVDSTENYVLRSHNKISDTVIQTALKLGLNGNMEIAGTFKSGGGLTVGTATMGTDGGITGTAWNAFGSSPDAISAIQNYVSGRLAAFVGFPGGGTTGQALVKASNTANDFTWGGPFAPVVHTHVISDTTGLQSALDLKANAANAALTGNPTAPTPTLGDNDTSIATTAFVQAAIGSMGKRSLTISTAAPSGGVDGDVWFQTEV
ncbi:tail fiber protein [Rhizobium phage RL38J1]|uniref:Putative head decoration or putative tail fiber protein n=1 Tax=Rhizobium phage RL38J1 TaxID=2663232 RepID=A0A6B9J1D0_9CAUD|nr:tail fiber protein [Rhizobium phage RL38J1]QGZ13850.1 putative head decoration or putative tail fiber protein [Rhizobium phage RL38J1]